MYVYKLKNERKGKRLRESLVLSVFFKIKKRKTDTFRCVDRMPLEIREERKMSHTYVVNLLSLQQIMRYRAEIFFICMTTQSQYVHKVSAR